MTGHSTDRAIVARAARIIRGAGYLTMATAAPDSGP